MELDGLSLLTSDEISYNSRVKCWVDFEGNEHPYELMIASRRLFRMKGNEVSDYSKEVAWRLAYEQANAELFGGVPHLRGYER